jgi:hypothetical protein
MIKVDSLDWLGDGVLYNPKQRRIGLSKICKVLQPMGSKDLLP